MAGAADAKLWHGLSASSRTLIVRSGGRWCSGSAAAGASRFVGCLVYNVIGSSTDAWSPGFGPEPGGVYTSNKCSNSREAQWIACVL
jgi:hypothetical protein